MISSGDIPHEQPIILLILARTPNAMWFASWFFKEGLAVVSRVMDVLGKWWRVCSLMRVVVCVVLVVVFLFL